jgi:hypothetical protein
MSTFDPNKPVQTRNGRKARILCTDLKSCSNEPIVAIIDIGEGYEEVMRFKADGRFLQRGVSNIDLINIPDKYDNA